MANKQGQMKLKQDIDLISHSLNERKENLAILENKSSKLEEDSNKFMTAINNLKKQNNIDKNKKESGFSFLNLFKGKKKSEEEKEKIDIENNQNKFVETNKDDFIKTNKTNVNKSSKKKEVFKTKEYIEEDNHEENEKEDENNYENPREDSMNNSFCMKNCILF